MAAVKLPKAEEALKALHIAAQGEAHKTWEERRFGGGGGDAALAKAIGAAFASVGEKNGFASLQACDKAYSACETASATVADAKVPATAVQTQLPPPPPPPPLSPAVTPAVTPAANSRRAFSVRRCCRGANSTMLSAFATPHSSPLASDPPREHFPSGRYIRILLYRPRIFYRDRVRCRAFLRYRVTPLHVL